MNNVPKWLWAIVAAVTVFILLISTSLFFVFKTFIPSIMSEANGTSGPSKVVFEQLVDLKNGDMAAAYSLISNSAKDVLTQVQFNKMVATYPELSKNKSENFNSIQMSNNQATLDGTLTAEDGTVTPVEYKLVLENGGWKIYSIKVNP